MPTTQYGDISPRTAAFASKDFLKRALPYLLIEKFGQAKPLPQRSTKTVKFRRYNSLDNTPKYLVEGVTPTANKLTATDVTAVVKQMGDRITITDVVMDTHEDPVLREGTMVLSEQAAQMVERMRFEILRAGTNVMYTNGTSRTALTTTISTPFQRRVTRALKRQNARVITTVVRSTPSYETANVAPSYIALVHPDLEADIRDMAGFVPIERYGSMTPYESEIGKVEDVRYLSSTIIEPWADAATGTLATNGGVNGNTGATGIALQSTSGTNPDVYPILYIARDAYGLVPLKGKNALTPMVVNPKPSDSDPLAQRGHISWKTMQTAVILNDMFMVRAEVVASA